MTEKISFVKALQQFFTADGGKKLGLSEVKALTPSDRDELFAELQREGYDMDPLKKKETTA